MKQKVLNEKQHEILGRLEKVLKEASENNISFIYDTMDCSLLAYNNENVEDYGPYGHFPKKDEAVSIDFEKCTTVKNFNCDYTDSFNEDYCLSFK